MGQRVAQRKHDAGSGKDGASAFVFRCTYRCGEDSPMKATLLPHAVGRLVTLNTRFENSVESASGGALDRNQAKQERIQSYEYHAQRTMVLKSVRNQVTMHLRRRRSRDTSAHSCLSAREVPLMTASEPFVLPQQPSHSEPAGTWASHLASPFHARG